MVDLNYDIKSLFSKPIVKVTSDLVPHSFHGNRYQVTDAKVKTAAIIDTLGELSAAAQKLNKPITTHQKLRQFDDQTVYLMADPSIKPRGIAIGLLKVGKKDLFVYNQRGEQRKVDSTPCVLDFYIHDTHQRTGYGKALFDAMLDQEHLKPSKCTIDRPSDKMINFMKKHYGLKKTIPQPNHYVVFEGYFDDKNENLCNRPIVKPYRVACIAGNAPNHCNRSNPPEMLIVSRCETQPHYCMAEIIERFGTKKR